jgi:hypothetical protein
VESNNEAIVGVSIVGLADLGDINAIPLIETRIRRARRAGQPILANDLARFDDARVAPLLDEFVKDPKGRKEIDDSIRRRHEEQK